VQTQIEQTKTALIRLGVEVEFFRWYDENQTGDILHFFGRIPTNLLLLARRNGLKVVVSDLLGGPARRSPGKLRLQHATILTVKKFLPSLGRSFDWNGYELADACVALTPNEAHLMSYLYGAPREKVQVVPNGVEDIFLNSTPGARGKWLVCIATITPPKRVLELAEAAISANTPLWIIGKPYADSDPYAQQFLSVPRLNPNIVRYEGAISDRAQLARIYREARGFVLLSRWESLSLSALEAAACECPLLLSDLPWARSTFKDGAAYCPIAPVSETAISLRRFHDAAPQQKLPAKPPTWSAIAEQLKKIYEQVLK
jgi:glycosyltransferase involved in cell wall biosynthesis